MTQSQIKTIKGIKPWQSSNFHGNRKTIGGIPISMYREILEKRRDRELSKISSIGKESHMERVRKLLHLSMERIGTPYFKVMIEGNSGIYYASPTYMHDDYNKCRLFDKTEKTLKIMQVFNSILAKKEEKN